VEIGAEHLSPKLAALNSQTEFINSLSFGEIFSEISKGNSVQDKFVKDDNNNNLYKVLSDEIVETKNTDTQKITYSEIKVSYAEDTPSEESTPSKQSEDSQKQNQQHAIHHGISLNLLILNKDAFVNKLPSSLKSFINETVEIVKSKNGLFNDTTYKFSFKELDLKVLIQEIDSKVVIKIELSSLELKEKLFTEENNKILLESLKKELAEDDIELEFIYTDSGSTNSDHQNSNQSQDEELTEQTNEEFSLEG
jgi:hypothetical protein